MSGRQKSQLGVKMVVELLQVLREWNVHPDDLDEEEFVKRMFLDLRGKEIFDEVMGYVHTTDRKFYSVVWEICWLWRLVRLQEEKDPKCKYKTLEGAEADFHVLFDG